MNPMVAAISYKRALVKASLAAAAFGFTLVLAYILVGHELVRALYESDLSIVNQIMRGKAITPVEAYLAEMDTRVLKLGVYFVLGGALGLLLVANLLGLVFSGVSFLVGSFVIFLLLDLFPALVKPMHFDIIPYFSYRLTYVPDPALGFRERPFNQSQITNFRGFAYSPVYGIDVRPQTVIWQTDEEGFRNQPDISFADIVVIGSSFAEYGTDLENTYPRKLEKELGGPRVVNLAKAGYGPLQYLEVVKRYALQKKPKYVLFTFYPATDIDLHIADWLKGKKNYSLARRSIAFGGFFARYGLALQQTWRMFTSGCWTALQLGFQRMLGEAFIHPDVAVLRLPDNVTEKILFTDHHLARSADELLRSPEWRAWEKVLVALKQVSEENQIVPLLVYIPAETEIYAKYSTLGSGVHWLQVRESQIATSSSNEEAARILAAKVGMELISLRPVFEQAARRGKLIYHREDAHWNEEGVEIAAKVTAEALKARLDGGKNSRNIKPKTVRKDRRPYSGMQHEAFDRNRDSVITRTLGGKITAWNRYAEELYGWTKEEAIGKVSHNLLHTQFPQPLEQIDAELVQNERWEGKLVHVTRDGRRVVVESRWNLKKGSGAVIEINTASADSLSRNSHGASDSKPTILR